MRVNERACWAFRLKHTHTQNSSLFLRVQGKMKNKKVTFQAHAPTHTQPFTHVTCAGGEKGAL